MKEMRGLYYYSEQYSGYAEGMAGGTGRSGDSSEVYNGRKNLYRYGRPDTKRVLWQTQRRKDVCDVPGESGRGERDVRAVCERRKGCTASEFFFGAERNCQ